MNPSDSFVKKCVKSVLESKELKAVLKKHIEEQLKRESEKKIRYLEKNTRPIRCTYCHMDLAVSCASSASLIQHQTKCYPLYKDAYKRQRELDRGIFYLFYSFIQITEIFCICLK